MFTSRIFIKLLRRWFRAQPLIQLIVFTEISASFVNFEGKVFDAKAWRWRKQWVPCKCGISSFISAENPGLFLSITGAPSVRTAQSQYFEYPMHVLQRSLPQIETNLLLWWLFSALHRKRSSLLRYHHGYTSPQQCISWLQFETSVVSSNWKEIFKGLAYIREITCSKIS